MIISALNDYYTRLAADESVEISPLGFSRQKIAFEIVVSRDGKSHTINDARIKEGKKERPRLVIVPGGAKPSGSGINPCFLWDNSAYMLSYKTDDTNEERTKESFEAFRQRHLDLEDEIEDEQFSLVCKFLSTFSPSDETRAHIDDIGSGFGVFRIEGSTTYVHDRPKIKNWWITNLESVEDDAETGQCLVTGKADAKLARIHEPKIKGVTGAQSSGASIVSFNFDAVESYDKEQGSNSPVSEAVAFQYSTALNFLLNSSQRIRIGDATTVFWTDKPSPAEDWLGRIIDTNDAEDESTRTKLNSILATIAQGGFPADFGKQETEFYVLGLSPNAARISIRFWLRSSLKQLIESLHKHFSDLEIVHSDKDNPYPALWQLLAETARESKDISPQLSGSLTRSVLTGEQYPHAFFAAVIRRIKADREIRHRRAAILKAILNRHYRIHQPEQKEITVALDPNRKDVAYQLGRLFAQLEKAQEDAQPTVNDTIKDRFFGSASATPASVFPRIIRMSQHHLGKLEAPSKIYHEKSIQQIYSSIKDFPNHLNLQQQGLFSIGYYHQRQHIFTKKEKPANEE